VAAALFVANPRPTGPLACPPQPEPASGSGAAPAIETLYQDTAVALIRLAYVILSDQQAAEDVVAEAFCRLYQRWDQLSDPGRAHAYVRASVINGCRSVLRRREVRRRRVIHELPAASAETAALGSAERDEVIRAVDRLPGRQREALVLRFYLELPDEEIARLMGIRPSSVRSAIRRALHALGHALREGS
jgi:RNA polymerase sigma-70 factor (sigma-E family)